MSSIHPFPAKSLSERLAIASAAWLQAKGAEQRATALRLAAEQDITTLLAAELGPEGASHFQAGEYQVTVTTKLTRTLDPERVASLDQVIPPEILRRLIDYKPSLKLREYRYLEANEPQHFQALVSAVTTKPAKPTIDITVKEP